MSEQTPRRRRRPQQIIELPDEEEFLAAQEKTQEKTEEPHRIVIAQEDDQPDWMVSAGQVSGAASRRTNSKPSARNEQKNEQNTRITDEGRAILAMKKNTETESGAPAGQEAPGERPAAQPAYRSAAPKRKTVPAKAAPAGRKTSGAKGRKPRKLSKKAKARRDARIRRTMIAVSCIMLLAVVTIAAVMGGTRLLDIKQTLDRGDGVFYPNIYVNGIPLAGKTLDEAKALVTQQVDSLVSDWKITLRTQDGRSWDITGADLKMQYDVNDQLDQLWSIGHAGSSSMRYEQVKALEEAPAERYTSLTYDLSAVNQILTQIKGEIDKPSVSATRINDPDNWPPYAYTDDEPGLELDISGMNEKIIGMVDRLESGVVDLTPSVVQAPITREYLEGQIVQLASFETSIGKTGDYVEARHENIRIGTERFDRLTIKSGESVSFNKVAGKRTASNGYQPALELAYGEYREGYGGGICQVSSTLYNAVVNAGLEVKTRYQHSLPSSYVDLGLDATVQDGRLDFVFKNNTSADIYISAEYYKGKNNYYRTKFTIYGRPDPNGYTYKLESEVKEPIPIPEPTIIPDTNAQYVVYDDETKQVSEGKEGYIVDVYLVTQDSKGLTVSRELQYTDTYKAQIPKIYVGVTPRETPAPDILFND